MKLAMGSLARPPKSFQENERGTSMKCTFLGNYMTEAAERVINEKVRRFPKIGGRAWLLLRQ